MKTKISWAEKLQRASAPANPHIVEAPAQWVGGQTGKKMVIPSALELDAIIRKIPDGQTVNIKDLRADYAQKHGADITCPMTSGIFLRMIAENAEEERRVDAAASFITDQKNTNGYRAEGKKDITPYWRVVADNGQMPPKIQAVYDLHH